MAEWLLSAVEPTCVREMDADRMDYLQRDSFFTGVAYGNFDQTWLLENLGYHVEGDKAFLAIVDRAIFAFEIFCSVDTTCLSAFTFITFQWELKRC